jgi:hypothetical protein
MMIEGQVSFQPRRLGSTSPEIKSPFLDLLEEVCTHISSYNSVKVTLEAGTFFGVRIFRTNVRREEYNNQKLDG